MWEKWILSILLPVFFLVSLQGKLFYCLISTFPPTHICTWGLLLNSWEKHHPTNLYLKRNRNSHCEICLRAQAFHLCVCVKPSIHFSTWGGGLSLVCYVPLLCGLVLRVKSFWPVMNLTIWLGSQVNLSPDDSNESIIFFLKQSIMEKNLNICMYTGWLCYSPETNTL